MDFTKLIQTKLLLILFLSAIYSKASAQVIDSLLATKPEQFAAILANNAKHQIQILYTTTSKGQRLSHSFGLNADNYFYPASTVKLPACIFALEKLNSLKKQGINAQSTMHTEAAGHGQKSQKTDSTAENLQPNIAHYLKKILLVSDNDAFNRLYEFIGQKTFNQKLHKYGFNDSYIIHRLESGFTAADNRHTNPISFYKNDSLLYKQPAAFNNKKAYNNNIIHRGTGYYNASGVLVNTAFDFRQKNKFSLANQHELLQRLIDPDRFPKRKRFNLTADDRSFLLKYMSMSPLESTWPHYHYPAYWPSYCKFLYLGSEKSAELPPYLKIYNKVGDAYGYLIDNAYFEDSKNQISFFLSAVILCNNDGIFNDDRYEYETIGLPFMRDLGQLIYNYELSQIRFN
jgi:hypothetical protein